MQIVPLNFTIATEELHNLSSEAVEASIKKEIIDHMITALTPMLDNENFINMEPSEDGSEFLVTINLMLGSTEEYIDATAAVTTNLLKNLHKYVDQSVLQQIIQESTKPLIDLVY